MQYSLLSSSVGRQRVSELSKEKLRIQNIVETLCPRLRESKAILQEIIWSLTPGRCCKKMTQALAERAVEVTSSISRLLEGAEETPQLLDNIFQLEQILRDIYVFVQSETQQNMLLRILFAEDLRLRIRYVFLDIQLRGFIKPFEQTVKTPVVLYAGSESLGTTIQEDHPDVASQQDGAQLPVAEIVPSNSSAIHANVSFFNHANNTVVHDGVFYAAHNLVVKQVQNYDRTPQGIVEGADVFTLGDVLPKKEIYKGRGYRVYSAHSTAKTRAVKIKLYEGSRAKDRCSAAASFSQKVLHPNVLHLIGVSALNSELPFLVFDESTEWAIESIIASALSKDLKQSLYWGLQTVAGLSSGLDYLRTLRYPFTSVGLDHFAVNFSHYGNILIGFDPEVLPDETHEHVQRSGASDGGNELDIFHGLCQKTFDAACKAHYEFQKVQRNDLDELDADDDDLDEDRFEEIEVEAGTQLVNGSPSDVLSSAPLAPQLPTTSTSSISPFRKSSPSACRRELVWKSPKNETVSLEETARQFQSFLLTFSTELEFNRRRGRYTTKTAHRCPGYNRIEITLTPDISRSAIVSNFTPIPHEICPVCKEIVKDADIFACICGREDNESIPTIRCSICLEWHHRPCVSTSENKDQSFVCRRCEIHYWSSGKRTASVYYRIRGEGEGYVMPDAGEATGITVGDEFEVYEDFYLLGTVVALELSAFSTTLYAKGCRFALNRDGVALKKKGTEGELRVYVADESLKDLVKKIDPNQRIIQLVEWDHGAEFGMALEDGKVVFDIYDPDVTIYGLTRMPFTLEFTFEAISPVIHAAAHFYWHRRRTQKTGRGLAGKVKVEATKLKLQSVEYDDDLRPVGVYVPTASCDLEGGMELLTETTYGWKIVNNNGMSLYPALFYFDISDWSITPYYYPPTIARGFVEPPLKGKGHLTVGYGDDGWAPHTFYLREGQNVDVGILKLFLSRNPVDLSHVAQSSPFLAAHPPSRRELTNLRPLPWDTIEIFVVQRRADTLK